MTDPKLSPDPSSERPLLERGFAQWPQDSVYAGMQNDKALDQRTQMQYLGVLALLGSIVNRAKISHDDRCRVEQAFIDANVLLRKRGSEMYYERCSGGGYSAFWRSPPNTDPQPNTTVGT